jgi:hypothetical protein
VLDCARQHAERLDALEGEAQHLEAQRATVSDLFLTLV